MARERGPGKATKPSTADTAGKPSPKQEWREVLEKNLRQEVAKREAAERGRQTLRQRRLHDRSEVVALLTDCFSQIGGEPAVSVKTVIGPAPTFTVSVESTGWSENVEVGEAAASGAWKVRVASGRTFTSIEQVSRFLEHDLMRALTVQLAPQRAEALRKEREQHERDMRVAEASRRDRELLDKLDAQTRKQNRTLDHEARMIARGSVRRDFRHTSKE